MNKETHPADDLSTVDLAELVDHIRHRAEQLGFQQLGITDTDLQTAEHHLHSWLAENHHGEMEYMDRHGLKRSRPGDLIPGTTRVISVRMDYLPHEARSAVDLLKKDKKAYVSRYALGRDYHKLLRSRLQKLAQYIQSRIDGYHYRVFTDSAPVLEKALAEKAGLGWIGKHSNLINRQAGSWFFLGEIYTDLPLPIDAVAEEHCGDCQACIEICPTRAIIAPYQVDARLCISYLTIEYQGIIDEELRPLLGNRIYGCDDCQLCCPWNRFARVSEESDYQPRHGLDDISLLALFNWTESDFMKKMEGSAIRRIGYISWQRNLAIALGNAEYDPMILTTLETKLKSACELVSEHISWAIEQQITRKNVKSNLAGK
ncbi:MAG: tRNA epoxyqueuosine(34) reductase QueG [Gammaproteobacteria bacterium]|nr:tRNA epoxyqueuosine(34) reductase QueG [Gammaproteobacteria bacterium]MDX2488416.1 tRNA epoxyqueuosine(34) reductase QueG [Gammaproteobacteria bacterium]